MKAATTLFVLLSVGAVLSVSVAEENRYCSNHDDCAPGDCCVQPVTRYARAACQQRRKEGEQCRPDSPTEINNQLRLISPTGETVKVENAYLNFCPCDNHLSCDRSAGGVCRKV